MLSKTNVIANNHVKNAVDIERDSRTKNVNNNRFASL